MSASAIGMRSPIDYEQSLDAAPEASLWLDKLGVERRTPAAVLAAELHSDRTG